MTKNKINRIVKNIEEGGIQMRS